MLTKRVKDVRTVIEYEEIHGRRAWEHCEGHAAIVKPGDSVLLHGREANNCRLAPTGLPTLYANFFRIGDEAEFGSYNLIYTGTITAITAKTVTITEESGTAHRMSLYAFDRRNWDFDAEVVAKHNAQTMMEI